MPADIKTGPVYDLVKLVVDHGGKCPRTDGAMAAGINAAIDCAVVSGMRWTKDDARAIQRLVGHKCGQYNVGGMPYGLAVKEGNESACKSMEEARGFGPWMWPGRGADHAVPGRLAPGEDVFLDGLRFRVTTMEAERLILCHYDENKPDNRKPKRRVTLTREQVSALAAASTPTPEPEIPALRPRYRAIYAESIREETTWSKCTCEANEKEACWFCRGTRDRDVERRQALTRAARTANRGRGTDPSTASLGATVEDLTPAPAAPPEPPKPRGPRPLAMAWGGDIRRDIGGA